jgi:SAM-dependent methyltransferase
MFLAEAERLGYRVTGLDLGPENRLFAAEFLGVEVLDGDFLAAEFEQLIEHVAAPGQYVDKARQVLKPGGHLMITTPNLAFARPITQVLKWLGQPPIGDALGHPPNHCVLFEPKTIRWLLGSKGFSVISIQTNPTGLKKQRPVRRLIDSTMLRIPKPLGPNMLIVARSGLNSPNGL